VYEDPDPQASPLDPAYEAGATPQPTLYPIPGAYAGTCGVTAGGGPVATAPPGTPGTNSAGQVSVSTGCRTGARVAHGPVRLVQYPAGSLDRDYAC
jgi:hypothetical protein